MSSEDSTGYNSDESSKPQTSEPSPLTSPSARSEPDDMDKETRLKRIRFLVDQSKLYADFLATNIDNSDESNTRRRRRTQPIFPKPPALKAKLYPHQEAGCRWLVTLFENGLNGILADEMGLGKTLEVIAFLCYLDAHGVSGPFIVVAPLSTVSGWYAEISRFAPSIKVCNYWGPQSRRIELQSEVPKSQVVITSYELVMADAKFLGKFDWQYVIVDEGHRLKNIESRLMRELKRFSSANRLLLTGTPLQNNLTELWALLNFLLPDIFTDVDIFHTWFESGGADVFEGNAETGLVNSLHEILRPFLLRRLKSEVGIHLPPKREYTIYTGLSELQTDLYRSILDHKAREFVIGHILAERTPEWKLEDAITDSTQGSDVTSKMIRAAKRELATKKFSNMMMQLRLACDSPYLFWWPWLDEDAKLDERIEHNSGKLVVLQKLMENLTKGGHRSLIFSQFTKMLDVLEDWATFRGYRYLRLDGSTSQADRQDLITEFDENEIDLFLLSTRSGGQGLNLTAADTVILLDSDWNPQQDLQAMARVHRIGQTKPVLVFRLVAGDTVEQDLLDRARSKLELTNIVIEKGNFKGVGSVGSAEEHIKSMGRQLQQHRQRFKGSTSISAQDLQAMLDRTPKAYRNAASVDLGSNIVCSSVDLGK